MINNQQQDLDELNKMQEHINKMVVSQLRMRPINIMYRLMRYLIAFAVVILLIAPEAKIWMATVSIPVLVLLLELPSNLPTKFLKSRATRGKNNEIDTKG